MAVPFLKSTLVRCRGIAIGLRPCPKRKRLRGLGILEKSDGVGRPVLSTVNRSNRALEDKAMILAPGSSFPLGRCRRERRDGC